MRKSLKIVTVAAVLFIAVGAIVLVYANAQNALNANGDQQTTMQNMQTFFESNNQTFCGWDNRTMRGHMRGMPQMQANGLQSITSFFENATLSTVQGSVVSEFRGMLILDTGSSELRVLLPQAWSVDNEVVGRVKLFNGTFASPGQTVTIKVLENNVFSNANFSINMMLAYEAINATSTHAYAVLPFNIQPAS
jgi:hypothetical protein